MLLGFTSDCGFVRTSIETNNTLDAEDMRRNAQWRVLIRRPMQVSEPLGPTSCSTSSDLALHQSFANIDVDIKSAATSSANQYCNQAAGDVYVPTNATWHGRYSTKVYMALEVCDELRSHTPALSPT